MTPERGTRRFAPTLFATLLTVVGIAAFIRLGMWQMHRAAEKQTLQAQFASGENRTVRLTPAGVDSLPRYQQVEVQGTYDSGHQVLLDNMPSHNGQPGYRVLTPLALPEGGWVLVDRGWVPLGATRSDLPDVTVGEQSRTIVGRLDNLPEPGVRPGDNPVAPASAPWPRVLSFPRHAEVVRALDRPLQQRIVLLDPAQPDGYERVWRARDGFGPERHLAYAAQWFTFAVAALVIYLMLSFKRRPAT